MLFDPRYSSGQVEDQKKYAVFASMFRSAWTEFQLAILFLPNSAGKKKVLSAIEQANNFYHQQDIPAMREGMLQMVEEMKICLLPLKIKEKANDLLNLLKIVY